MGMCFNCGKVGHCKFECKKEKGNQSREKEDELDNEEFGLNFRDTSVHKKTVRFKDIPEEIPDVGQLCTIDGRQYHTFNKNSWIGDTGASCFITYDDTNMYDVTQII